MTRILLLLHETWNEKRQSEESIQTSRILRPRKKVQVSLPEVFIDLQKEFLVRICFPTQPKMRGKSLQNLKGFILFPRQGKLNLNQNFRLEIEILCGMKALFNKKKKFNSPSRGIPLTLYVCSLPYVSSGKSRYNFVKS